ncbi:unnamed protein product, partial [Rhizoctonia solani]
MPRPRRRCVDCHETWTAEALRRHYRNGCPVNRRAERKRRRKAEADLRRWRCQLREEEQARASLQPRVRGRRRAPREPTPPALIDRLRPPVVVYPMGSPEREHPDFRHDTPGAGPGPGSRAHSPRFAPDNNADPPPWMNGLTPRDYYAQRAQRALLRHGAFRLPDYHRLTVQAFNYKVDTDVTGRAYAKLRRAFPDRLNDLPMDPALQAQATKISAYDAHDVHCCVNSCVAFTGGYAHLEHCPWCFEPRYKPHPTHDRLVPRRTFRYLPIIPRLINMYRNRDMARRLRYRSRRRPDPQKISDIFDGQFYQLLLEELVSVDGNLLGHRFFSRDTDIALGLATDGFGPFKKRDQQCWPLVLVNYNLHPSIRTRLENILCLGVIPGPQSPKEIDTFLEPLIDELEELARGVPAFDNLDRQPFLLHAYLIALFGDMPAVAKLMCMKGHNGKVPCRACKIRGVQGPNSTTLYVPLSRPFDNNPDGIRQYDPLKLPLRTHPEYIEDAIRVEEAANNADADRHSRRTGIKGLSALVRVPGLVFPGSFPHDFMHLIFENIIPTLLDIWTRTGDYETFGLGDEDYLLAPDVWTTIAAACPLTGNTIPSAFGCRVPDLKTKRRERTSESMLLFATLIGPALLRKRFRWPRYYQHFIRLVQLINLCIDFEIAYADVQKIREGFAAWVKDYEGFYYMDDPDRLRACTLPLHALLHIADDIEAMGPVWAYWAFPMERFCGALARASKSRHYPYSSINRRVLQVSQLSQIKLIYGLTEELNLEERRENVRRGTGYNEYSDLIFVKPLRVQLIPRTLVGKVANYITNAIGTNQRLVQNALVGSCFKTWGKMQRLETSIDGDIIGGDLIRGATISRNANQTARNASHVRFYSRLSRWRWDTTQAIPVPDDILSYGRAEMFIVIGPSFFRRLAMLTREPEPHHHRIILAVITPFVQLGYHRDADLVEYRLASGNYAGPEIVDVTKVDCLVGRVMTELGDNYVVERTSVVGQMNLLDAAA